MAAHQGRHYLFFCTSGFASYFVQAEFFVQADLQSDCYSLGFPAFPHYKCLYSMRLDCESDRT